MKALKKYESPLYEIIYSTDDIVRMSGEEPEPVFSAGEGGTSDWEEYPGF